MKLHHLTLITVVCIAFTFCNPVRKNTANFNSASPVKAEMLDNNTYKLTEVSADETYGYAEKNAIQVGGKIKSGAQSEQYFLNALLGPGGEEVTYRRQGSCCSVKSKNALFGDSVPLDIYEVTYFGLEKPIILYINMYDSDVPMKAPKGFTFRK